MKWLRVFPLIGVSLLASADYTSALSDAAEASTPAQAIDTRREFVKPQLRAYDTASEERRLMELPTTGKENSFSIVRMIVDLFDSKIKEIDSKKAKTLATDLSKVVENKELERVSQGVKTHYEGQSKGRKALSSKKQAHKHHPYAGGQATGKGKAKDESL